MLPGEDIPRSPRVQHKIDVPKIVIFLANAWPARATASTGMIGIWRKPS